MVIRYYKEADAISSSLDFRLPRPRSSSPVFFFLPQFFGFKRFLYFVKSSLPTSNPPLQNTTSIKIRLVLIAITFVFVGKSKSGMTKVAAKKTPEKIIRNIPNLICQFFEFFISFPSNVG